MTPVEEQILRNQMAEIGLLVMLLGGKIARPERWLQLLALESGEKCLAETNLLLRTESEQGRTVHAYTP